MARYQKNSTPKLTRKLIDEIARAIESGAYIETCVAIVGISKNSFYSWLRLGNNGENKLCAELAHAVRTSMAKAEMRDLNLISRGANGIPESYEVDDNGEYIVDEFGIRKVKKYKVLPDWKASAWRLERRNPKRWRINSEGEVGSDVIESETDPNKIEIVFVDSAYDIEQKKKQASHS